MWAQARSYIFTKFRKDLFRHSKVDKGDAQTNRKEIASAYFREVG
jgi:hypothetical protein